jgi:formate dehydrogenase iron-sulfur subunit
VLAPAIAAQAVFRDIVVLLCGFLAIAMTVKLLWELTIFNYVKDREWTDMKRTALLMLGPLKLATIPRFICGAIGGVVLPALVGFNLLPPVFAMGILPFSLIGELLERYLFFAAAIPHKMPGGVAS